MARVLIIGAGGVGSVVAHKCAMAPEVFGHVCLASRTLSKCRQVASEVERRTGRRIEAAAVDADDVRQTVELIRAQKPDVVVNVALPYQDLPLMDACLEAGVDYLDTANYEPRDVAKFEYKWQWAYQERYRAAGRMALLGSGFDPGATNVYCAYAQKHLFDEIHRVDIVDCNAGSHGHAFATNFNPEINLREVSANGRYWEDGQWIETRPLQFSQEFDFPGAGSRKMYLIYHEELESLCRNIRGLRRIRFWMTFSDNYITHMNVLKNVGMLRIDPVEFQGQKVVPIQFLKALLPDPASLAKTYTGKTCIGCVFEGVKDGRPERKFIYNICDHAECYEEVGGQAVSYTTGVPAMIGAKLMVTRTWKGPGVWNMEQLDPDPFMADLNRYGLPWEIVDWPVPVA
jgi:saccharopine dehydrogenase (NAD+, L-lysine-forming)